MSAKHSKVVNVMLGLLEELEVKKVKQIYSIHLSRFDIS